ncbi:MAG: hypothetical protein ABGZ17_24465 [Planctomycetaceae bacterium]
MADKPGDAALTPRCTGVDRYDMIWALLLAVAFSIFYISIAQDYRTLAGYTVYDNLLFGADHVDALQGWINKHKGTHPLLPFLVVPLSAVFETIAGSYELGLAVMSGCIGGLAVLLFFALSRMLVPRHSSIALSVLFGLSMNQMVFSGLPDTYVLVAISIMPSFMLLKHGLRTGQVPVPLWIAAGVLAFSITITTMVQMIICLSVLLTVKHRALRPLVQYAAGICAAALAIGTVLVLIQHAIFPRSQLFFESQVYGYEMQYVWPLILEHPGAVADELIKSFWLFNFVGQDPLVVQHRPGLQVELVYYRASVDYGWWSMAAATLWILVYIWAAFKTFHDRTQRAFTTAAWLCVASHLALHSFFSTDEVFLYAPHYSFIVLLTAISPASTHGARSQRCWLAVALLIGVANYQTHTRIVRHFGGSMPTWLIAEDAQWRYFPGEQEPPADWNQPGFDDRGWDMAQGGFGYGDGDDRTVLAMQGRYSTIYVRTTFELSDLDQLAGVYADINYDDGFVVYLNGYRVMERNAPPLITHQSLASSDHEGGRFERHQFPPAQLIEGTNTVAIVALNSALNSSDSSLDFRLSKIDKKKWR